MPPPASVTSTSRPRTTRVRLSTGVPPPVDAAIRPEGDAHADAAAVARALDGHAEGAGGLGAAACGERRDVDEVGAHDGLPAERSEARHERFRRLARVGAGDRRDHRGANLRRDVRERLGVGARSEGRDARFDRRERSRPERLERPRGLGLPSRVGGAECVERRGGAWGIDGRSAPALDGRQPARGPASRLDLGDPAVAVGERCPMSNRTALALARRGRSRRCPPREGPEALAVPIPFDARALLLVIERGGEHVFYRGEPELEAPRRPWRLRRIDRGVGGSCAKKVNRAPCSPPSAWRIVTRLAIGRAARLLPIARIAFRIARAHEQGEERFALGGVRREGLPRGDQRGDRLAPPPPEERLGRRDPHDERTVRTRLGLEQRRRIILLETPEHGDEPGPHADVLRVGKTRPQRRQRRVGVVLGEATGQARGLRVPGGHALSQVHPARPST